jgi:hypothetical protein
VGHVGNGLNGAAERSTADEKSAQGKC